MSEALTQAEVRELRRRVYGADCSDKEWEHIGWRWMKPENVKWLREKAGRGCLTTDGTDGHG